MFRSNIKSALRNLIRNRVQSLIQILSLALGLTVCILISFYTYDELTTDRQNENLNQIYRIEDRKQVTISMARLGLPLGPIIEDEFPEVQQMCRILHSNDQYLSRSDESGEPGNQILLNDYMMVDSGFLEIFPQEFLIGDPETSLRDPNNIILTEGIANNLFGAENPVGQMVYMGSGNMHTVSAVIRDPLNTHLRFQALGPIHRQPRFRAEMLQSNPRSLLWGTWAYPTYIILHGNADPGVMEDKIEDAWHEFCSWANPEYDDYSLDAEIALTPLKHVHFSDVDPGPYMSRARKSVVVNFFLLGIVILVLGIINYINLATARASLRFREVCIKKITGATRGKMILYFLTESFITTVFAFLIAIILVRLLLPQFVFLLQADISFHFLSNPIFWMLLLAGIVIISVLAGLYPSLQMSSGSPVLILSMNTVRSGSGLILRRVLMVIQFSAAIILMIGMMVIHIQIMQMKNQDLGFDTEHIVWTSIEDIPRGNDRALLIERLKRIPEIEAASLSNKVPGMGFTDDGSLYDRPGHIAHGLYVSTLFCDSEFFGLYGLEFIRGNELLDFNSLRGLFKDTSLMASSWYILINEAFWKASGVDDPVGYIDEDNMIIKGITKDFHFQTLEHPIRPLALVLYRGAGSGSLLSIRINSPNIHKILEEVEKEIDEVRKAGNSGKAAVELPVNWEFIDETFDRQYDKVQRVHNAYVYFFILAMIIACLGLFGLSTFMAQRRIKEIGIRKTMGSSERQVFLLLATDFMKWVSLAIVFGCPAGWYLMRIWQQQYAFKAEIGIWVYVVSAFIAFIIAFLTVVWQSLKTARKNPVDSLRYE